MNIVLFVYLYVSLFVNYVCSVHRRGCPNVQLLHANVDAFVYIYHLVLFGSLTY